MKTFAIELKNAEDAVKLVTVTSEFAYEIELKSGDMLADGKSIMGAMAMTGKPSLELVVHAEQCEDLLKELDDALEVITRYHDQIAILHCVSQYPTAPDNLNLLTITYLKRHYGQYTIGFSDHTIGIAAPVAAVALGAEIVEKHITIDRRMKGTDQQGSLGPDGVNRMIRDIRLAERWLGREELYIEPAVAAARVKLERSIATRRDLQPGDMVKEEDLHLLSPGDGYKWTDRAQVIGKRVKNFIPRNELIYPKDLL